MDQQHKNYYEILEVSQNASSEIIKKAYFSLAKKYHPDSTILPKEESLQKMILLNKAYEVLSDPIKRKEYDTYLNRQKNTDENSRKDFIKMYIQLLKICEDILNRLKKEVVYQDGYELSNEQICDNLYNLFVQTAEPLISKLYPLLKNDFKLLTPIFLIYYQFGAAYTWTNDLNKSMKILKQSLPFVSTNGQYYESVCQIISNVEFLQKQQKKQELLKNKNISDSVGNIFRNILRNILRNIVAIGIVIACLFVADVIFSPSATKSKSKPSVSQEQTSMQEKMMSGLGIPKQGITSQYVPNEPVLNTNGYSVLTIDNSRNDLPVYVRLWTAENANPIPIRSFTIAGNSTFTVQNIAPGTYEVRYKYLYENEVARTGAKSKPFILSEEKRNNGVYYDQITLTLYKVRNGNTRMRQISADEI